MESIKDWCISRQLWWGHRIPVWYCKDCSGITVSVETPAVCEHCGRDGLEQDPDVLDTWFSSALWTHSTLGWPDDTEDMRYFYPTSVMQTGYDILFFWVARMIMMGIEDSGQIPFHTVYLNGLIRDEHGQKMSKMRGNVIRPDDAIASYGVDALRFALTTGNSPGNDLSLGAGKLEAARNFVNKLWNATRFVLQSTDGWRMDCDATACVPAPVRLEDRWILSRLHRLIGSVQELMQEYQIGEAARQIHDFVWTEFCDWYIEMAKFRLKRATTADNDEPDDTSPAPYLITVLDNSLRLLHPFMPFVTEELWQHLQSPDSTAGSQTSIMVADFPRPDQDALDPAAVRAIHTVIDTVRALRNIRAERKIHATSWLEARVYSATALEDLQRLIPAIESLSRTRILSLEHRERRPEQTSGQVALILADADVVVAASSAEETRRIKEQLRKEVAVTKARLEPVEDRLNDTTFVSRAPADVVDRQRELAAGLRAKLQMLEQELRDLS